MPAPFAEKLPLQVRTTESHESVRARGAIVCFSIDGFRGFRAYLWARCTPYYCGSHGPIIPAVFVSCLAYV